MADAPTDVIKERIDIVALVGESLPLKRAGSNFKARCPFHEEDTPSFMVSPSRQMFHCFGCGESGDAFSWLMKREGMSFPEALRVLAQRAGVPLTFERSERREEKEQLRETLDLAVSFYQRILLDTPDGRAARTYLEARGLTAETIRNWRLGYCPPSATPLKQKAGERGMAEQALLGVGILHQGHSQAFEFFHGRILFPLTDAHGSVVGLAGRVFGEDRPDAPKYINSPETALYTKSRVLYGLDRAKDTIRKENLAVLVEGYTDVLLSHQAGVTNVVATSGTALTEDHVQLLRRFTDRLAFAFDADAGGDAATRRAVDLTLAAGFLVSVVVLPNEQDPADLAAANPQAWRTAVQQREEMFSFFLRRAQKLHDTDSAEEKKAIAADLLPLIARVPDRVVAGEYAQRLASTLRIDPRFVYEALRRLVIPAAPRPLAERAGVAAPTPSVFHAVLDPHVQREERFLALLLADPDLIPKASELLPEHALEAPHTQALYRALKGWYSRERAQHGGPTGDTPSARVGSGDETTSAGPPGGRAGPLARLRDTLPEDLRRSLDILAFRVDVEREREEWNPAREALALLREFLLASIRRNLRLRIEQLRAAPPSERPALLREIAGVTEGLARAERVEW